MTSEKKRHRPILIEEKLIIDSTTTTTPSNNEQHQHQHIENTIRQWYSHGDGSRPRINESISAKIDRILRKIHSWTDDGTIPPTTTTRKKISIEPIRDPHDYDNLHRRSDEQCPCSKRRSNSCRRTYRRNERNDLQINPPHRPYSMIFIDRDIPNERLSSKVFSSSSSSSSSSDDILSLEENISCSFLLRTRKKSSSNNSSQ